MTLILRYMTLRDIPQVTAIDRVSFDPPWAPQSYEYEIDQSSYSHMVVLEDVWPAGKPPARNWWRRFMNGFTRHSNGAHVDANGIGHEIVGYGGLWHIMDEAHISTIATHPNWRGQGYGEVLLAGMVGRALTLNSAYVVLEVRVSNHIAQNLYRKYEFVTVDTKRNYYRNNSEDAYDMRLRLDADYRQRFFARWDVVRARCPFEDYYSGLVVNQR